MRTPPFTKSDLSRVPDFEVFEGPIAKTKTFYETALRTIKATLQANDVPLTEFTEARLRQIESQVAAILDDMRKNSVALAESLVPAAYDDGLMILPPSGNVAWNRIQTQKVNLVANEMQRSLTDGLAEIGRWVQDGLREAQLQATIEAQTQAMGFRAQRQRLMDLIDENNLRLPRGYRGDLGGYVEMVTRTNLAEANRAARNLRTLERGISLVIVKGHGATDSCGPFEDTVISLLPNDQNIPDYVTIRMSRKTHLFGPNCRHERLIPAIPAVISEDRKQEAIQAGRDAADQLGIFY